MSVKGAFVGYRNWLEGWDASLPWTFQYANGRSCSLGPVAGFPAENLHIRQLSEKTRFGLTSPADTDCSVKLLYPSGMTGRAMNLICVLGPNPPDSIVWQNESESGTLFPIAQSFMQIRNPLTTMYAFPEIKRVGSIELVWDIPPSGDYFELTRIYGTFALNIQIGVDGNWSLDIKDTGDLDTSEGEQWYESKGVRTRRLNVSTSALSVDEAFSDETTFSFYDNPSIYDMMLEAGTTGDVIIIPRSSTGKWISRLAIYGHLQDMPQIRHLSADLFATSFTVVEER